jgi:hypothetical protein
MLFTSLYTIFFCKIALYAIYTQRSLESRFVQENYTQIWSPVLDIPT